jgi:hypothetical protein
MLMIFPWITQHLIMMAISLETLQKCAIEGLQKFHHLPNCVLDCREQSVGLVVSGCIS